MPNDARAERPRQAVVLAGGLGTRLRPLTDTTPKPMIAFHGRPFLEYLIAHLRDQGFERVVLLLGYLADNVRDYFGDGARFGVAIEYMVSPIEDETGTRLRRARDRLDPLCLLAYCDNYWPMPFDAMWARYLAADRAAQVVVYRNRDGYTRDNLKVEADGRVSLYDKTRAAPGLAGVDIGFLLMPRDALDLLP
ncbi:MAG: NDP-sugar synthase, partial [Rhodospirillales bacterium]